MDIQPQQDMQAAPDQAVVDRFESIYFNMEDSAVRPGADVLETAKRSIAEIVAAKLESVARQGEENIKAIESIMSRITAPGHRMTAQEAMEFQVAELRFVESQAMTAVVAKKSGDAIKTLFTNQ
jgi:hypothetical protein